MKTEMKTRILTYLPTLISCLLLAACSQNVHIDRHPVAGLPYRPIIPKSRFPRTWLPHASPCRTAAMPPVSGPYTGQAMKKLPSQPATGR